MLTKHLPRSMQTKTEYDFNALITMYPTENGGRESPVYSGYRPAFSFNTKMHFCGQIVLVSKEELKPGDIAVVTINLLPAVHIRKNIKKGDAFSILEGARIVGSGIIQDVEVKKIVNDE